MEIIASDGSLTAVAETDVTVMPVNDAPYMITALRPIILSAGANTTVDLSSYFADVESDPLTFGLVQTQNVKVVALEKSGQVQVRAAELLGITKSLLQYKLKKYHLTT